MVCRSSLISSTYPPPPPPPKKKTKKKNKLKVGPLCKTFWIGASHQYSQKHRRQQYSQKNLNRVFHLLFQSFVLAWFLRILKHNVWVSQSILLQLLPMRTQNPNLSCASAFVRQSQTFHSINALCTHIFKLTKHSIGKHFPCTVRTYKQDLVLVVVALCISYAPKVFSHCSRCCCCLLVYDRQGMGIHLDYARGPGLYQRL